jgi:hypothetical protein
MSAHTDNDAFNHALCRLFGLVNTPAGSTALRNKLPEILKMILDTKLPVTTVDEVQCIRVSNELICEFIKLLFTIPAERLVATYPEIRKILQDDIARIHNEQLVNFCTMYRLDPETATATELARAMTRGIRVSFRDTTGNKATHFGTAFLHMGVIHKKSKLERAIKNDIFKFADFYSASDLFRYLIAKGRA